MTTRLVQDVAPRRSRRRSGPQEGLEAIDAWAGGAYLSPWPEIFNSAGPRAADYGRRVGLGLDAANNPVVGPGIGGYASPQETDNATGVFMNNLSMDQRERMERARAEQMRMVALSNLVNRLGAYQ
jgi:hypothetical protein